MAGPEKGARENRLQTEVEKLSRLKYGCIHEKPNILIKGGISFLKWDFKNETLKVRL